MKDLRNFRTLEGQNVNVALCGGSRIDGAQLVSAGRPNAPSLWLFVGGLDVFIPTSEVADLWEDTSADAA